jgi:hypothetical protein
MTARLFPPLPAAPQPSESRTRLGIEIAAAGVAGGIVGDSLLRAMPWGLNVALGTMALVGVGAWLVRRHHVKAGPDAPWLAITAVLLGLAFLRRDAETLVVFDMLALIATLALAAASVQGESLSRWYALDYARGIVTAAAGSIFGSLLLVFNDVQWRALPQDGRLRHTRGILLGLVIAAPLLIIFAALFASADPIFQNVLSNVFSFDMTAIITHTFFFCFWGALVAGLFRWGFLGRPVTRLAFAPKPVSTIVPLATALALIDLLFLMFVVVQLRYFFGGADLVEATSGMTYASHAREGFFQLVAASALVLAILLGAEHLVSSSTPGQVRVFRQLAGLLLALLAVVMVSALERMRLYVSAYGLTGDRLYATAFMILLFGVFAWFSWTALRGQRQRFAFGALMQALAVLAGLHVLNPDAFIARTNLNRPVAERPFDAPYAASLSADAVPVLMKALPRLSATDQCQVARRLLWRWGQDDTDWRTWNWSRSRAQRMVREHETELRAMNSCPPLRVRRD